MSHNAPPLCCILLLLADVRIRPLWSASSHATAGFMQLMLLPQEVLELAGQPQLGHLLDELFTLPRSAVH